MVFAVVDHAVELYSRTGLTDPSYTVLSICSLAPHVIRGIEPDADPPWREFKGSAPSLIILVNRVIIAVCAWYCGLLESAV